MMKYLKGLVILFFSLFCIYILESACFRLVESYANWRLALAWGKPSEPKFNAILKKIPMDHFVKRPTDLERSHHLGYWVGDEHHYSSKVMSFTRPLRDSYENYIQSKFEPLAQFEIRDYGEIQGVVLPGFKKKATVEDVRDQKARRVGDALEFARGIFVKVVLRDDSNSYREKNLELEASFGFMLEKGFACVVLPIFSSTDLLDKITRFQEKESLLAKNIFAWADGKAATILMESCQLNPSCWKAVMISYPDEFVTPPNDRKLPWTYFEIDEERWLNEDGLDLLYQWIELARSNENLYASRLAGLIKISQGFYVNKSIPSIFVSYVINCSRFIEEIDNPYSEKKVFTRTDLIQELEESKLSQKITPNIEPEELSEFDLKRIEESISKLEKQEEFSLTESRPNFDCEIVREYRGINADDTKLNLVSNRDLILKLGLGFEEMGQGVLDQIRTKDPLFYRYYNSLRAIEESPLN
jgi:hypothetical protein